MPDSALGMLLRQLRSERGFSLRDLAQRGDVDHAYIHRLETGGKEAPSSEVVAKLITALTPRSRDAEMLRFLATRGDVDAELVEFVRKDHGVTFDEFHMLTTVVNRGARPDYAISLARIRRFMQEDDDG